MRWLPRLLRLLVLAGSLAAVSAAQSSADSNADAATRASSISLSTASMSQMMQSAVVETLGQTSTPSPVQSASGTGPTGTASSATNGASSTPRVHLVKAGVGGFVFEPDQLNNVSVGDTVTFEFYPPDHSVARAEFGSACVPYEYTGKSKVGFWSGTQWVNTTSEITHWNLTINSTEPIFYYCAAPDSCKGKHMIGVINPNATQTLDAQMLAAARADFQVAPGEPVPKESSGLSQAQESGQRPSKLSTGAIVGIAIGCLAFLLICMLLLWSVTRRKSLERDSVRETRTAMSNKTSQWSIWKRESGTNEAPSAPVELPGEDYGHLNKY